MLVIQKEDGLSPSGGRVCGNSFSGLFRTLFRTRHRTFVERPVLPHRSSQAILTGTSWRWCWSHFTAGEKQESKRFTSDFSQVTWDPGLKLRALCPMRQTV